MKKFGGTRYNSAWDAYTGGIIVFTLVLCLLPPLIDFALGAFIIGAISFAFVLVKHRLAITFSDRKVLRSIDPLVISPVRPKEFISKLLSVNPDIKVEGL